MEDIPRELERELSAQNRLQPVKRSKKWELILLGDSGELRPVRHIKGLAVLFAAIILATMAVSCGIYYYSRMVVSENNVLRTTITDLKAQEKRLRKEIDSLVSRYMMGSVSLANGKDKGGVQGQANSLNPEEKEPARKMPVVSKKTLSKKKTPPDKGAPPDKEVLDGVSPSAVGIKKNPVPGKTKPAEDITAHSMKKAELFDVAVDDFELSRKREGNALKIKFVIKNKGRSPQNISGRIFVLLKPDEIEQENWAVSPKAELIDGKPGDALLGQFFSINRYKTVRLTLSSDRPTEYYKQCTVFVYNEGGSTILEKEFSL